MFQISINSIQKHLSYVRKQNFNLIRPPAIPTNVNLLTENPAKKHLSFVVHKVKPVGPFSDLMWSTTSGISMEK